MGTLWGARAGCAEPGVRRRWPRMCGIGAAEAVLHIRPGLIGDGSAESCGNVPVFNAGEILPCAERPALHMGARLLRTDILVGVPESCGKLEVDPRGRPSPMCSTTARAGRSSSGEAPLPSDEASTPAIGPRGPRPARQRPSAGPRREPGPARPRPDTAGDRPRRTGPGGARPSPAPPGPRSPPPHRPRPLPPLLARKARLPQVVPGTFSSGPLRSAPLPAFPSPRITLFLLFPNDLQWRVKLRADQQPDASNRMSFPPVSRDFSAGFGDEGEGRGPRVGDRCPGPRAFVDEEPGPRVPKPGMKPLLRRGGGRGLPWTRGRLGDGTGHRAPQPCRRPPPGGESYATRRTWGFSWRAPGRGPGNETHSCNGGRASRRGRDPGWSGSRTGRGCGPNDMRGQDAAVRVMDGPGLRRFQRCRGPGPAPIGSLAPHASYWTRWSRPAQWVVR